MRKKELCILLSRLKVFEKPSLKLEQYPTDSEIAGDLLWSACMLGDIEDKEVIDLGSGTGLLGLGALLMGAKKAFLVDIDEDALVIAAENKAFLQKETGNTLNAEIVASDVSAFGKQADLVIMNPPFGTKNEHVDMIFLKKAMALAPVIYSLHKASTKTHVDGIVAGAGFSVTNYIEYDFPLKSTFAFHTKRIERIKVGLWRIEKRFEKKRKD